MTEKREDNGLADLFEPPYYAVVFTSRRTDDDASGYRQTADEMVRLAAEQDGYLGVESISDASGLGITVSYWRDEQSIAKWRDVAAHRAAQKAGRDRWYQDFRLRVAKVERQYEGP